MKRLKLQLLLCAGAVLSLTMCQQEEGPMAAGLITAADPQADALLSEASRWAGSGNLSKAESKLKELVTNHALAPCAPEGRYLLGQVYERRNDPRSAFKQYQKIVANYHASPVYAKALDRQLAMGMAAANGEMKVKVMGLWKANMESSVVQEWLNSVIANAPYNDMAATATFVLGKFLVNQGKYEEAAKVYSRLVENYPDSRYAPDAQLMVAQLWASSRTRGDRNLANLKKAQEAYEDFSLRFPKHPDANKALKEASNVRRLLVQQELEVGRYYLERSHEYGSAIFCFENVIRQKSTNPEAAAEAEKLLGVARGLAAASPKA